MWTITEKTTSTRPVQPFDQFDIRIIHLCKRNRPLHINDFREIYAERNAITIEHVNNYYLARYMFALYTRIRDAGAINNDTFELFENLFDRTGAIKFYTVQHDIKDEWQNLISILASRICNCVVAPLVALGYTNAEH